MCANNFHGRKKIKQVKLFLNENKAHDFFNTLPHHKDIPSTNPSNPGVTATPPHPKYQNNNINNTKMKMSEKYLDRNQTNKHQTY